MKQITPEIKARVFALYWGQKIAKAEVSDGDDRMSKIGGIYSIQHFAERGWFVQVKSLSSITDEDAIEVAKIEDNFEDPLRRGKALIRDFNHILWHQERWSEITDYLRSKGYALPAYGFNVDELVEAGVFKLKEVNND